MQSSKRWSKICRSLIARQCIALAMILTATVTSASALPLEQIKLPPGFKISLYTANVPGARQLCLSPKGTLFISTKMAKGKIYAVPDKDKDGKADQVITIVPELFVPNGIAMRQGSLYVAQINRVLRYDNIESDLFHTPKPVVVSDKFPNDEHHGWKYIKFGPDDLLYIPVGAPCNVCERNENQFACMLRMKPDGSGLETFARGIRNTVGFAWHPVTKELWFTDNGRDWINDETPPDELNRAPQAGLHFGFPYRYGMNVPDPEFGKKRPDDAQFTPPAQPLDPHVASIGMCFYTGKKFPPQYQGNIFIAEHGSWNRASPLGARVTMVSLDPEGKKATNYKVFAEGWNRGGTNPYWGRPADVLQMPDGSLLVSDDHAGVVYRIAYEGEAKTDTTKPGAVKSDAASKAPPNKNAAK